MKLERTWGVAWIALLIAGLGCESDGDPGDEVDAMTQQPPSDGDIDGGEDAAAMDAAAGAGGSDGSSGAGGTGGEPDASPDDAASDAGPDAEEPDAAVTPQVIHVYVGGYSTEIAHLTLDRDTGMLTHRGSIAAGTDPSYLAIRPQRDALYAVNESSLGAGSEVLAFSIDPETGDLEKINDVPSGGEGAVHVAVHPTGDWIAVAHYESGHVSILPIQSNRGLGGVIDVDRGPSDAARKAHQVVFDARGTALLVPCLENDYVLQYQFNLGALVLNTPATAAVSGGPRHMAISPDQRFAYVLSETGSTLTTFDYDGEQGRLANPETIDSEQTTKGASAHVAIHPSGRWLYLSNRAENSLGVFALSALEGDAQLVEFETGGIATPRDFAIEPAGQYLILANQAGAQSLRVYEIDPISGALTFVSATNVGGEPATVGIAILP